VEVIDRKLWYVKMLRMLDGTLLLSLQHAARVFEDGRR
jgi:hypothetical protein